MNTAEELLLKDSVINFKNDIKNILETLKRLEKKIDIIAQFINVKLQNDSKILENVIDELED